jgi:hypothetical protein
MDIRLIRRPHPNRMVRGSGITRNDPYLEWCWLPVVGPSIVALVRLVADLTADSGEAHIPMGELSRLLGLGRVGDIPGRNNKLVRSSGPSSSASASRASAWPRVRPSASTTTWRWFPPGCWNGCPKSPGSATLPPLRPPTRR